jgi:predicted DNA-binding protein YlxM (UPF0122 family)
MKGVIMNKRMSGEEIAKVLRITRQAVSNTLKRAMGKLFKAEKKINRYANDFEIALIILKKLNALDADTNEIRNDFNLFPPEIRKKIILSAKNYKKTKIEEDPDDVFTINEINNMFA